MARGRSRASRSTQPRSATTSTISECAADVHLLLRVCVHAAGNGSGEVLLEASLRASTGLLNAVGEIVDVLVAQKCTVSYCQSP
jgi:hypothetical protein